MMELWIVRDVFCKEIGENEQGQATITNVRNPEFPLKSASV